jgi:hypothetical protein
MSLLHWGVGGLGFGVAWLGLYFILPASNLNYLWFSAGLAWIAALFVVLSALLRPKSTLLAVVLLLFLGLILVNIAWLLFAFFAVVYDAAFNWTPTLYYLFGFLPVQIMVFLLLRKYFRAPPGTTIPVAAWTPLLTALIWMFNPGFIPLSQCPSKYPEAKNQPGYSKIQLQLEEWRTGRSQPFSGSEQYQLRVEYANAEFVCQQKPAFSLSVSRVEAVYKVRVGLYGKEPINLDQLTETARRELQETARRPGMGNVSNPQPTRGEL